ncbi:MAG TPA: IPT/TIG domain-containing protein [Candidatus Acidoferrum sp.]|nr:IPT/TIG domain-containing protein [Candidatus Acidoferrum sp.]
MIKATGCWKLVLALGMGAVCAAQTLNNQALTGKYYFRHLSLGSDSATPANLTDPRSLIGTITFDGAGKYTYAGQQIIGSGAATPATNTLNYTVDPGGFVSLESPLRSGAKVNARFGPEALLGSSTETSDNTFDLFVAVPAPASGATFSGPFTTVSLEFPDGSTANARASQFSLASASATALQNIAVNGHAANLGGRVQAQQVTGATYTLNADGSGTLNLGAASNAQLLSGTRTLYVSASGNIVIGGSTTAGSHDLFVGVKAVTNATAATWNTTFWGAGLRFDSTAIAGYAGSVAARGAGKLTWTKRIKALGVMPFDFTGINAYSLGADGTGTVELTTAGLGAAGKAFVGAAINNADPAAYEIYIGVQVPQLTGTGVFLNPLGVVNAASFAPPGNPIAPGQFVSLFGTGLAPSTKTAAPPYPSTLNNVTVQVNGKASPIYFVSAGQINFLVPYSTAGPTATIVVQNNGVNSNTVTVPVSATAPGIYTLDQSGSGSGAILHADFSVVNSGNPAAAGETVLIYLTGMGMVTPALDDGTAGTSGTLYKSIGSEITVLVAGKPGTVLFNGLAPGFPGLYQINVILPAGLANSGPLPLAIQTANAYHDQVDIPIR